MITSYSFPEHKRKREVKKEQDTKFAEELKEKQTKDFVETLVDEIGFDLLKKFVDAGMRTQNHNFTKDLAIVIDTIRGLAYIEILICLTESSIVK